MEERFCLHDRYLLKQAQEDLLLQGKMAPNVGPQIQEFHKQWHQNNSNLNGSNKTEELQKKDLPCRRDPTLDIVFTTITLWDGILLI